MMVKKVQNDVHHYSSRDYNRRIVFFTGVLYGLFLSLLVVMAATWLVVRLNINLFK